MRAYYSNVNVLRVPMSRAKESLLSQVFIRRSSKFRAGETALNPRGRNNYQKLNRMSIDWEPTRRNGAPFCSRSLILFNLFTRGRKFVGSRRKVISSDARNRFIPVSKD